MTRRPHIIYFLTDQHRGQAMGHAGDPNLATPQLDRLAAEGVSFTSARANCPICTPSRGTIFSGRHAHAGPVASFFDVYKAGAPSTATLLRTAGYHTAFFGKWHCGIVRNQRPPGVRENPGAYKGQPYRTPERHRAGFQDWYAFENLNAHFDGYYYANAAAEPTRLDGYEVDAFTDQVSDYLRAYDRPEPLFLVLSVTPPHYPLLVPERWQRFAPEALRVRENFHDTPELRRALALYYAMVENIDWNLGRLREALAALPGFDDTLLVYFSDHGDFVGSHGRPTRKEHPHEESVRVPAIFHRPGAIPAQGARDDLFSLVDLLPTTLALAGVDVPGHVQGTSFAPALRGEASVGPDAVLLELVGNPRWRLDLRDWRGLVTGEWKYAVYETGEELLFNLAEDPCELTNLAAQAPAQRRRLRARLLALLEQTREPYFHVLLEHGVEPPPDRDVSDPSSRL